MLPEVDVVVIDGLNIFSRHYEANPAMSGDGQQVGGFVGTLSTIRELINLVHPRRVIVAWEGGGSKRRRSIDKDYKKGRAPRLEGLNRYYDDIPDTLENRNFQLANLINFLRTTPVEQIYAQDAEADDAIAYVIGSMPEARFLIASSDRDMYQLIEDGRVVVWTPGRRKFVTEKECLAEFRIHPTNFALAKAIVGDVGDNVKGVKGCGWKYLARWAPGLSTSETVYMSDLLSSLGSLNETKRSKTIENILASKDKISKNLRLVSLSASSLPHQAARRIDNQLESGPGSLPGKLDMMRYFIKEKLQLVDADSLHAAFRILARGSR